MDAAETIAYPPVEAESEQQGLADQAQDAAVQLGEKVAGTWLVNLLWYSVLEFIPGALWGLPLLTLYIIFGVFSKNPVFHQLSSWKIMVVLLLDFLVAIVVLFAIAALVGITCSGPQSLAFSAISYITAGLNLCKN